MQITGWDPIPISGLDLNDSYKSAKLVDEKIHPSAPGVPNNLVGGGELDGVLDVELAMLNAGLPV